MSNTKSRKQEYKQGKNIYYWYPRKNSVARFYAGSGRALLYCYGNSSGSDPTLGVFTCFSKV